MVITSTIDSNITLILAGLNLMSLFVFQILILFDVQNLNFIDFKAYGYSLLVIGAVLWVLWITAHLYMVISRRKKDVKAIYEPLSNVLMSQAYVLFSFLIFSLLFVRWSDFFDAKKSGFHYDNNDDLIDVNQSVFIAIIEGAFVSITPCTAFLFGWTLDLYSKSQHEEKDVDAKEKLLRGK